MSDYPLLTEADEDLAPVIEAVLKAERELPAWNHNRFYTLSDAIVQALYDHAVPRGESGEQIGQPSINQIKAAFTALSEVSPGELEGLAHQAKPIFSVQYHPEASPGPHDASYFFRRFRRMVERSVAGETVTGAAISKESVA